MPDEDGTSEKQVETIAADWLEAIRLRPGGAAVKMRVFFPRSPAARERRALLRGERAFVHRSG